MFRYLKENKGLIALTMLFSAIGSFSYVLIAILLQNILDMAISGDMNGFFGLLSFSIAYFVFFGLFMFLYTLFSKKLICRIMHSIREKVFGGVFRHNIPDFHKVNTADYLSALTNDVKMVEDNYLLPLLEIIQNGIIFAGSLVVMFYFDVIVTFSVLGAILVMLIVPGLFGSAMQNRQKQYSDMLSAFTSHAKDMLSGFEVIKSYGIMKYILSKFEKSNHAATNAKYSVEKITAANQSVSMVLAIFVQVVVIFLSAYFIIIGRTTVGALIGMVQVSSNLSNPLLMIFANAPKIKSVRPIVERLNALSDYTDTSFTGNIDPTCQKGLSADNLSFSYDNKTPVLKNLSFDIQKGKKYALVGKNGSGKTTLIKLLTGCYSTYQGSVEYDNVDISMLDYENLTKLSTTIHQDVYMFNESIYDNICLHCDYSNDELKTAMELSGVTRFIEQTQDGLDTIIDENGSNLSGGQKQRIAVARAIIQGKPILILDEGTSAIDRQTAHDIESRLLDMDGLTLITITHNLNADALEQYDEIIFLQDGTIEDIGTYEELTSKKGGFYCFSQLKSGSPIA